MAKFQSLFYRFSIFNECFWRLSLYLLEIIMLMSLGGTLTQTKGEVGKVTFPTKGPMRGQYVFLMAKYASFIDTLSISITISGDIAPYFLEIFIT